jgi:hypothetical protein
VTRSRNAERRRRMRSSAANNTLITGGAGLTDSATTATKTLYGQ